MATYSLSIQTKSGSYFHRIDFTPVDENIVGVKHTMRDALMGCWIPDNGRSVPMNRNEAREIYRKYATTGYQKSQTA